MRQLLFVFLLCFSYPGFASPKSVTAITDFFWSILNGKTSHQTERDNDSGFVSRQRDLFKALYDQALIFKNEGKIDEAISTMTRAVEIKEVQDSFQLYIRAVNELALLHKEKGNEEEAVGYFKIALDYRSGQAAYELALIHTENQEWDQAEKLFKKARSYGYGNQTITYALAKMYKKAGKRDQAKESIRPLLGTVSYGKEAEFFLAKIQAEDGNVDAQMEVAGIYLRTGREYEEQGTVCPYFEGEDYQERAWYWIKKAAEKSIQAKHNVARWYKDRGSIEEAIKWMKKAAQEESFHSDGHFRIIAQYELALIYEEKGQMEDAIHWMIKAAKQGFISAQEKLAEMHAKKDDLAEAIRWMTEVASNKNDGPIRAFGGRGQEENLYELSNFHKLALLHKANGDRAQAIHWMEKAAVRRGAESAVLARIELAKMYEEDRNRQKAIEKLEEAKELHCPVKGYHFLAKYELALLLEKEGNRKQAVEYMTQVAKFGQKTGYLFYEGQNYYLAAQRQLVRMHNENNEEIQAAFWKERTEPYNNRSVDTDPAFSFAMRFFPDSCYLAIAGARD